MIEKERHAVDIDLPISLYPKPSSCCWRRKSWEITVPIIANARDVLKYPRNVRSIAIQFLM